MKHRKIICLMVIAIALASGTPVLADYIGPNRTVTETRTACQIVLNECEYVASKNVYRFKQADSWSCSNESKPWRAYSGQEPSMGCTSSNTGDKYWSREEISHDVTTTYPPATISGVLQNCILNNGWCTTPPQLSLSANEPVSGYSILGIEGTLNNQIFACSGSSCTVPLSEGNNSLTYWAYSSFTDTSEMGSLSANVDTQPPTLSGTLSGVLGLNGWYTSPVSFRTSVSDTASRVESLGCTLNGAVPDSCFFIQMSNEGIHTITLTARDYAGLTRSMTHNTSIDTQPPALNVSLVGTRDSNTDWYTDVQLNGAASDALPGSGLSAFEYKVDQDSWIAFPASGELSLPEGQHTVEVRAIDKAGLTASSEKSFKLDRVAPLIAVDAEGLIIKNDWYIRSPSLIVSASDETSGLKVFEYSLDNDPWTSYTAPLLIPAGVHKISFWAEDHAGLATQVEKTYKVDTRAPRVEGSMSGVPGENGWFTSNVTLSASASDPQPGSGIIRFTYTLNGNAKASYTDPLILADGKHTIELYAEDDAGRSFTLDQVVNVDTIPPSLEVQTSIPGWVRESITVAGTAADEGSGLSKAELSTDGGQSWQALNDASDWSFLWNTSDGPNGPYEVVVRVMDKAGLVNTQTLKTGVDLEAPAIDLPAYWFQWDSIQLDIREEHSGLSKVKLEISDPQDRWPARVINLNTARFPMHIKWDRRLGDDAIAPAGTYNVKVTAVDQVGNSAVKSSSVTVLLDILPPGPTATPLPTDRPSPIPTIRNTATAVPAYTATQGVVVRNFGSTLEPVFTPTSRSQTTSTPRATSTKSSVMEQIGSVFKQPLNPTESTTEIQPAELAGMTIPAVDSGSNILWGAAAAAMMGSMTAYALEEKRKQQEEKAKQKALEAEEEERREKKQAQKQAKLEAQWAQERAWEEAREAKEQLQEAHYQAHMEARVMRRELEEEAKRVAEEKAAREREREKRRQEEEKKKAEDLQAGLAAYYNGMRQGESATHTEEIPWWEKAIKFIDDHQVETSLGIGATIGLAAVAVTLVAATAAATVISLPFIAAVAVSSALAAGFVIASGTVALNHHYDRPLGTNVWTNVKAGAIVAAVISGVGLFAYGGSLTYSMLKVGNAVGSLCVAHPDKCKLAEPAMKWLDLAEEFSIRAKLSYHTWARNREEAEEAAFELQMEYSDGGIPGNYIVKELGGDVIQAVLKYGDEAIGLFRLYGVDAAQIIVRYNDDGIDLLKKHGKNAVNLIQKYDDDAIQVLKAIDVEAAEKLLSTLDDDVLDYAFREGSDAVEALSRWSPEELRLHGVELALRSKKDAKVLADVRELVASKPIDPKNLTDEQKAWIDAIAEYSTQYADGGQVVLGKWVDYGNGFTEAARNTGSAHYNPHPDMWNTFSELGKESRSEVAWLVNQQVIQTGISKDLPFEYSLNGISPNIIDNERAAIKAIFSGKTDKQIKEALELSYLPIRIKELQELQKAGYKFTFDEVNNSYIFIKP